MPIPVISIAQMREWEAATWAAGQTEAEVIRQVGERVGRRASELTRLGDRVLVLAGPGNNGQDALAARGRLSEREVETIQVVDPGGQLDTLRHALARRPSLVIDGLFGIGLNRALSSEWNLFIRTLNEAARRVLAIDVPSGLNADTGEKYGETVIAGVTLTVAAPKMGLIRDQATLFVGRLEVATNVGLVGCPFRSEVLWTGAEDFENFPPVRRVASHKGSYGHLGIFAGTQGFHGAAVLASRGAQRAQPGLITLYVFENVYHQVAAQLQAVMVSPWQTTWKVPPARDAYLIGPGLAAEGMPDTVKMFTRSLWRDTEVPVVVDASALDWVPLERPRRDVLRVVSPHPGEAARVLRSTAQEVQANRVEAVRKISQRFGDTWVILKGHQTVIGRSSGEVYVNSSGNPYMAQGGSGDLLSGYIAGLLVQPELQSEVARTLRYAVWQHGAAADYLAEVRPNWVVEELAGELGNHRG